MRNFSKKSQKVVAKIFLSIFIPITIFFAIIYIDSSRNFLVNYVSKCLQKNNVVLKIDGLDKNFSKIDKIFLKTDSGEFFINDISLNRESFWSRFSINIENFAFKNFEKKSNNEFDFDDVFSALKFFKIFVKELRLKNGVVNISNKKYFIKDLKYTSNEKEDFLEAEVDKSKITANLEWSKFINLTVIFENVFGSFGNLYCTNLSKKISNYKLYITNADAKINSDGHFKNFVKEIDVDNVSVNYKNQRYDFKGKIYPIKLMSEFYTKITLEKILSTYNFPNEISKNFKNISADINLKSDLRKGHKIFIDFKKNNEKVGDTIATFFENSLELKSNFNWINIFGYKIKSLNAKSKNLKNFDAQIGGENFSVDTEIIVDKNILVNKLNFHAKDGSVISQKPFLFDLKNPNVFFKFDFENLNFFERLMKMTGKFSGIFSFSDNQFNIRAKIPKLAFQNYEIYNGNVAGNWDDLKIELGGAKYDKILLRDFSLQKKNAHVNLKSKLNNVSYANLQGDIVDENLKFFGKIINRKNVFEIKKCEINLKNDTFKMESNLSNKKQKGNLDFYFSKDKIDLNLQNFAMNIFGSFWDKSFPNCFVNGRLNLSSQNDFMVGQGNFKLVGLVSANNILNIDVYQKQNELSFHGNLKNKKDDISLDVLFPINWKSGMSFSVLKNSAMKITILGHVHPENLFELPDGYHLRGEVKSNLNISGNLDFPIISGDIKYSDAYIAVAEIILKNGTINLRGSGNKFLITRADFFDSDKKKANISGDGILFFSGIIPNIKTNLKIDFDNFRLFDSDELKINILGKAEMFGLIDDMKIAGQAEVPFCEISYLSGGDTFSKYKDIVVENDIYLSKKKKQQNDFFLYDVNLKCPKIKVIGSSYDLEFFGDLNLESYKNQATLSGNLALKNGKLDLFGRRMKFSKGSVEFFKNYPFDPKLDLSCERNIESMQAVLEIKSIPGKEMSLNLHSHPNYSPDVILSQMMFGKTTKNLSVGEAAQLAHAVQSLNQKGYIFSILNTFQNTGLVDSISFSSDEKSTSLYRNTQTSSDNKINIKAGKYLSDNVFISVNKKEEETSFDVDVSLDNNSSLKVNTLGEFGVNWKYRY